MRTIHSLISALLRGRLTQTLTVFSLILTSTFASGASTPATRAKSTSGETTNMLHQAPWFDGTADQAFTEAAKTKKPIFLYWGAIWCPPCNQLKASVFSDPKFKDVMANAIAVYLDGDTDSAQIWGEKLKIAGYPTMLILTADDYPAGAPVEIQRIESVASFSEFAAAVEVSLSTRASFDSAIANIEAGKNDAVSWKILVGAAWGQLDSKKYTSEIKVSLLKNLVTKAPSDVARAILTSALLSEASSVSGESSKELIALADAVRADSATLLANIFKSKETVFAARSLLTVSYSEVVNFIYNATENEAQLKARRDTMSEWAEKAASLREDKSLVVYNWLWSFMPEYEFWKLENKDQKIPAALAEKIRAAAIEAEKLSISEYDRHVIVSDAAYILDQIGDKKAATAMLTKELKRTKTPWYYNSSLAAMAHSEKNYKDALKFAKKARMEARTQGHATRIQWIVGDLVMTGKSLPMDEKRMIEIIDDYYQTAQGLSDGFSGRNATRAKTVAKEIKKHPNLKKLQSRVLTWGAKCAKITAKEGCESHFASLATPAT